MNTVLSETTTDYIPGDLFKGVSIAGEDMYFMLVRCGTASYVTVNLVTGQDRSGYHGSAKQAAAGLTFIGRKATIKLEFNQ